MFFAVSASQRPWIAGVFGVLGVVCEVTNHHDVAVSLITAAITIATLAEKPRSGRVVVTRAASEPASTARPGTQPDPKPPAAE